MSYVSLKVVKNHRNSPLKGSHQGWETGELKISVELIGIVSALYDEKFQRAAA